jgi:hypothetical protein
MIVLDCAQTELIAPQNQELLAWLGLKFCFPLNHLDAFFCSHSLRILITFVRYKIISSATEGLVQQSYSASSAALVFGMYPLLTQASRSCLQKSRPKISLHKSDKLWNGYERDARTS